MTEYQEQTALVQWLRLKQIFFFANHNENNTHAQNRKWAMIAEVKAKKAGKMKGVPDLTIFLDSNILFLELKRAKKRLKSGKMSNASSKPSKEQETAFRRINEYSYAEAIVCYGAKEAIEEIEKRINTN